MTFHKASNISFWIAVICWVIAYLTQPYLWVGAAIFCASFVMSCGILLIVFRKTNDNK